MANETGGDTPSAEQIIKELTIRNLQPVSEDYVIWQWALSEARNPKWARRNISHDPALKKKILDVSAASAEGEFTKEEQRLIVAAFLNDPARLPVAKIKALKCNWYKGVIPVGEIDGFYMVMWPLSEQLAPSGKLTDYANAFKEGRFPSEAEAEFDRENMQRLYQSFDASQMVGSPILLSQTSAPPFCAIDGITRLCAINLKNKEGTLSLAEVPIILGVSPNLFDWDQIPRQMPKTPNKR